MRKKTENVTVNLHGWHIMEVCDYIGKKERDILNAVLHDSLKKFANAYIKHNLFFHFPADSKDPLTVEFCTMEADNEDDVVLQKISLTERINERISDVKNHGTHSGWLKRMQTVLWDLDEKISDALKVERDRLVERYDKLMAKSNHGALTPEERIEIKQLAGKLFSGE